MDSLGHSGLKNLGLPPGTGLGCFQHPQDAVAVLLLMVFTNIVAAHLRAWLLWKLSTVSQKVTVHKLRFLCTIVYSLLRGAGTLIQYYTGFGV